MIFSFSTNQKYLLKQENKIKKQNHPLLMDCIKLVKRNRQCNLNIILKIYAETVT